MCRWRGFLSSVGLGDPGFAVAGRNPRRGGFIQ